VSLRVYEHVGASLFVVYIAQSHRRLPCRSRVLDPDPVHAGPTHVMGDRSFLPHGFDSLRISMQNSSELGLGKYLLPTDML